jgi:hypothetical protein
MNEWGAMFWLASVVAVFSIPLISFALLMRTVRRITTRTLVAIIAAASIVWSMASFFWWGLQGG